MQGVCLAVHPATRIFLLPVEHTQHRPQPDSTGYHYHAAEALFLLMRVYPHYSIQKGLYHKLVILVHLQQIYQTERNRI